MVRSRMPVRRMRRASRSLEELGRLVRGIGARYAVDHPLQEGLDPSLYMNSLWCSFYNSGEIGVISDGHYKLAANEFLEGYCEKAGIKPPDLVLMPTRQSVAAIITVSNEENTIERVLGELRRLPLQEIIIVINGSTDKSFHLARQCPRSTIVHYPNLVGHDVGRSIGAKLSSADMVMFLDGDIPIKAEKLLPFIRAIDKGSDVALNDISPYIGLFTRRDGVTMIKQFLNRVQGRPELQANSMTAIPHMLSRKALQVIGCAALMVPPKAQAAAIRQGLRICAPASVDVISSNKAKRFNTGVSNLVSNLIIGDHVEALHMLLEETGGRLVYKDVLRNRSALAGGSA